MNSKIEISVPVKKYRYSDYSDLPHTFKVTKRKIRQIINDGLDVVKKNYKGPVGPANVDETYKGNDLDILKLIISAYEILVDAKTRFNLVEERDQGDLLKSPIIIWYIFFIEMIILPKLAKLCMMNLVIIFIYIIYHKERLVSN